MTKLEETLKSHPEMSPIAVTRLEIAKVSEPVLQAGLTAIVDLIELAIGDDTPPDSYAPLPNPPVEGPPSEK
jgi:hypothetical protein